MKTFATIAFTLSSLVAASTAQAQERQTTLYSGPASIELPTSILRGSAPTSTTAGETSSAHKVRIVLQSPYGN